MPLLISYHGASWPCLRLRLGLLRARMLDCNTAADVPAQLVEVSRSLVEVVMSHLRYSASCFLDPKAHLSPLTLNFVLPQARIRRREVRASRETYFRHLEHYSHPTKLFTFRMGSIDVGDTVIPEAPRHGQHSQGSSPSSSPSPPTLPAQQLPEYTTTTTNQQEPQGAKSGQSNDRASSSSTEPRGSTESFSSAPECSVLTWGSTAA